MPELQHSTAPASAQELLRLKAEYLMPCVYHFYGPAAPHIVGGEGSRLYDDQGRSYIDCYSGVTVMSAGHGNPEIIEPAIEQIRTLQHTTSIYVTEPVLRLAELLSRITPGDLKRSFFCASGTEAVEGALLLAALHTGRDQIVAMDNALHGRTRWAMNATGLAMWRTDPFPQPGVHRVPFGDAGALEDLLRRHGDRISAVLAEPVQGNGGIIVPPAEYWPAVRRLCDRHGVLLVLDEIQSGFNRTGEWFACQHWNVVPDILAMSKALGNGFPIAAFIATDAVAASYTRPGASTYGGNPVSATAALATIQFHEKQNLGRRAQVRGAQFLSRLDGLTHCLPYLGAVRGLGLMLGMPVHDDDGSPSASRCDVILDKLRERGVLAGKTGPDRNVLTFLPPLIITEDEIDEVCDALWSICNELVGVRAVRDPERMRGTAPVGG